MRSRLLTTTIKGLSLSTIGIIDDLLMDSWRDGHLEDAEGNLYNVVLNDAWLEKSGDIIMINDGDNAPVVLFDDLFVEISIS